MQKIIAEKHSATKTRIAQNTFENNVVRIVQTCPSCYNVVIGTERSVFCGNHVAVFEKLRDARNFFARVGLSDILRAHPIDCWETVIQTIQIPTDLSGRIQDRLDAMN